MALIRRLEPSNVMLVHGEKKKMAYLKRAIVQDLGIPTFDPPNGTAVTLNGSLRVPVQIPTALLQVRDCRIIVLFC